MHLQRSLSLCTQPYCAQSLFAVHDGFIRRSLCRSLAPLQRRKSHLCVQVDQPRDPIKSDVKRFEPLQYDFNKKAKYCMIELEIKKEGKVKERVTCSVAEALVEYIKPGLLLSPALAIEDPMKFLEEHFTKILTEPEKQQDKGDSDGRYNAAIPLYVLEDITPTPGQLRAKRKTETKVVWTSVDQPLRIQSMMSSAFKALLLGGRSIFTLQSRLVVERKASMTLRRAQRTHTQMTSNPSKASPVYSDSPRAYRCNMQEPSAETRSMVEWNCTYMPHVWPNVLMRSMPEDTKMAPKIALQPHSNNVQVKWTFVRHLEKRKALSSSSRSAEVDKPLSRAMQDFMNR
ncbi:MAG: hypothetical protein LQ340_002704 [Diploschistes diacapsis]|nr:MAG: hypothetical protein LQ340_002704 [Diploschistes diacapsis]